ncbi:PorP/SprF family type IX secretion system membrane protein [Mongoliitalea daihaiensis]|uniref:PorP/SprF family type IX secretion system membrane protein n=1 Tax=Mongoliitalea daihaiensis TaxID=2782006 RepID=UPI001F288CA9|nr:PorP/SprF family type IX secretion system membrane protein [Mongoliitalea daihaiensis]UJP66932.1 PorP/SprF family type IX secretion system membrane protein [Mongoliitalea daihaiensis]
MRYFFTVSVLFILMFAPVQAQQVLFSQFYAAGQNLNPALTGTAGVSRLGFNYRNQWPALDQTVQAFAVSGDTYLEGKNSGIGFLVNGFRESFTQLQHFDIGLSYSYQLRLGERSFLSAGVLGTYAVRSVAFDEVVLGTQLDIDRGMVVGSNGLMVDDRQKSYADLAAGLLFYNQKVWLGLSSFQITRPNLSFLNEIDRLPIRWSAHGGMRIDLEKGGINDYFNNSRQERSLALAFHYQQKGVFQQFEIGSELFLEPLSLGLWYRGIPRVNDLPNQESLIALVGFDLGTGMEIGYSYDFTLSGLGWQNTGGAHELSVRFHFIRELQNKRRRDIRPGFRF